MEQFPFEIVYTINIRPLPVVENTDSIDDNFGCRPLYQWMILVWSLLALDHPNAVLIIPSSSNHLHIVLHFLINTVSASHTLHIVQNLCSRCEIFGPLYIWLERVLVHMAENVAGNSWISVLVPCSTYRGILSNIVTRAVGTYCKSRMYKAIPDTPAPMITTLISRPWSTGRSWSSKEPSLVPFIMTNELIREPDMEAPSEEIGAVYLWNEADDKKRDKSSQRWQLTWCFNYFTETPRMVFRRSYRY